jgi:hypothetical protein
MCEDAVIGVRHALRILQHRIGLLSRPLTGTVMSVPAFPAVETAGYCQASRWRGTEA